MSDEPDIGGVCEHFWRRAGEDKEAAITRIDQIIDRQLAKANGILAFNGILVAGLTVSEAITWPQAIAPILLASISSVILLWMFRVRWAHPDKYSDARIEFTDAVGVLTERTRHLTAAIALALLALIYFMVLGIIVACFKVFPGALFFFE